MKRRELMLGALGAWHASSAPASKLLIVGEGLDR
jgi:hypothetical protein